MHSRKQVTALTLRPYQLLCMVCRVGGYSAHPRADMLDGFLAAVRANPDIPVTLRCNASSVYAYQDPGPEDDTGEGGEYNRKRDLDILQRLDLAPGSTLPARTLLMRLLARFETAAGTCSYPGVTGDAWRGCGAACAGHYEQGRAKGLAAMIPPRPADEMAREKRLSVERMYEASQLSIRPHILMCAVCHYGEHGGMTGALKEDNLVEFLDIVRSEPDTPVVMAKGADWMICAPCPQRVPGLNACVNEAGSGGLSNEKRDLDLLQKLGLRYGDALPARQLYLLLFERVPNSASICARDNPPYSVWWDGCGEANTLGGKEAYARGRQMLLAEFGSPNQVSGTERTRGN
jgi:hypothetical protein